jgi:hypothetical protein
MLRGMEDGDRFTSIDFCKSLQILRLGEFTLANNADGRLGVPLNGATSGFAVTIASTRGLPDSTLGPKKNRQETESPRSDTDETIPVNAYFRCFISSRSAVDSRTSASKSESIAKVIVVCGMGALLVISSVGQPKSRPHPRTWARPMCRGGAGLTTESPSSMSRKWRDKR